MNIKIIRDSEGRDMVCLPGRGDPRLTWEGWLSRTETAVRAVRAVLDQPRECVPQDRMAAARAAAQWLIACGVPWGPEGRVEIMVLEQRLRLLRQPPDPAVYILCRRCGSRIWGREALITGLGSECRRGRARIQRCVARVQAQVPND